MAPPYSWGSPDDLESYPRDPGEARRLLQEAGSPQGRSPRAATSGDVEPVARFLAESFEDSLGFEVELVEIPEENLVAAQRALVEKNLPVPSEVLVRAWFDLAAGYPPAVIHREYLHSGGAFRVGPVLSEFEDPMDLSVVETDPKS